MAALWSNQPGLAADSGKHRQPWPNCVDPVSKISSWVTRTFRIGLYSTRSQNCLNRATRLSGLCPAIGLALMAPIDVPIISPARRPLHARPHRPRPDRHRGRRRTEAPVQSGHRRRPNCFFDFAVRRKCEHRLGPLQLSRPSVGWRRYAMRRRVSELLVGYGIDRRRLCVLAFRGAGWRGKHVGMLVGMEIPMNL